jgi:hypothetical protein
MFSAGRGASSVPNPVGSERQPIKDAIGPIATLKEQVATLKQRAIQAADVARDAAADAAQMTNAHTMMIAQHCKLFLRAAFGINPDGTAITNKSLLPERLKVKRLVKRLVKTVKQYKYIIQVLTNWGNDTVLAAAPSDDHDAATVRSFCRKHIQGYSYVKHFKIEEAQSIDESPKSILKHKKSGGVVRHMLNVSDVIN